MHLNNTLNSKELIELIKINKTFETKTINKTHTGNCF